LRPLAGFIRKKCPKNDGKNEQLRQRNKDIPQIPGDAPAEAVPQISQRVGPDEAPVFPDNDRHIFEACKYPVMIARLQTSLNSCQLSVASEGLDGNSHLLATDNWQPATNSSQVEKSLPL